jgi:hypothetical protein
MWKMIEKTFLLLIFYETTGKDLFNKWGKLSIFRGKILYLSTSVKFFIGPKSRGGKVGVTSSNVNIILTMIVN